MADVRSGTGAPTLAQFAGVAMPSPGSAVYIDKDSGIAYAVLTGDVVAALQSSNKNSIASGESRTIPTGHQFFAYRSFTNSGTLTNQGDLVIL